jgi:hypothetical protein
MYMYNMQMNPYTNGDIQARTQTHISNTIHANHLCMLRPYLVHKNKSFGYCSTFVTIANSVQSWTN